MAQGMLREVVGTFQSADALEGAISALTSAGWDRSLLSLLAQQDATGAGALPGRDTRTIADDPHAARAAVVSDTDVRQERTLLAGMAGVIAAFVASGATILTGGAALAAVVGAAVAGGGAAAAVSAIGVGAGRARNAFIDEQIAHGGVLLWVTVHDDDEERRARAILADAGAVHVHTHETAVQP
jgi:hypothetical protein